MKKYSCVFIDLDDTLWDFRTNAYLSLQDMYAKYELKRYFGSFEHFFRLYTFRNKQLWERYNRNEITKEYLHKERFLYPFRQVQAKTSEEFSEEIVFAGHPQCGVLRVFGPFGEPVQVFTQCFGDHFIRVEYQYPFVGGLSDCIVAGRFDESGLFVIHDTAAVFFGDGTGMIR